MPRSFDEAFQGSYIDLGLQGQVCLGAFHNGAALLHPAQSSFDERRCVEFPGCEGFVVFDLLQKEGHHTLCWLGSDEEFAVLDTRSSHQLQLVSDFDSIRFHALILVATLSKRSKARKARPEAIDVSINVYSLQKDAKEIGFKCGASSAFLQHPKALPRHVEYDNPQLLVFSDESIDLRALVGITNDSPSARSARISNEISDILECLTEGPDMIDFQYNHHSGLRSKLKPHQEHGVCFIIHREALREKDELLSSHEHDASLRANYGGIVADVMGLGKTLTILTSILQSIPNAEVFQGFDCNRTSQNGGNIRTKATLVVVSSAQLLNNWQSEIEGHFEPEAFDVIVFHGPNRLQDPSDLVTASIVLTTYATIVAEHKGRKTLQRLHWFRIVLDEAHWIRNTASKQFKSVAGLSARNRWCLTGTPIQNKLDDIAALAAFLQLQPFPTKNSFQKGVLDPVSRGGQDFSKPLRAWLRAICIRRTEKLLQLPDSSEHTILVTMTQEEKHLYDQALSQTKSELDDIVSEGKRLKKYNVLFTAILRMRMLCNRGTFPKPNNSQKHLGDGQTKGTGCEQCAKSNDEDAAFLLTAFQFCPDCGRSLQIASPGSKLRSNRGSNSPLPGYSPASDEILSFSTGHSAKLSAVMERIGANGYPSKHIVFSYWTSTLDLLSILLRNAAVSHTQVDGRTSYIERSRRLQQFQEDNDLPVILMSIETGALGLNLTAANFVHIVEPQWNPSVEAQAVARALRMGQTRQVSVIRYVVKSSVEQNILRLQKKKKSAAKFVFNLDAADELDGKLEDLKFVLDLNSASL